MRQQYQYRLFLLLVLAFGSAQGTAQTTDGPTEKKWDVNQPPGTYKDISFTTSEGTWLNLDVSPDGQQIVFDMLGDLYLMPITGGQARLLRGGLPWEVQPRFSPDGKKIAFTSDAGGGDNIWVVNTDGTNPMQITSESFRLLNNPAWTPDGQSIVARKHYTSQRSLGAGEMWLYNANITNKKGAGIQLTKRKNDQQDAGEPYVSPNGRYVYFSEDMSGGTTFEYNKDPNGQIYIVRRYDMQEDKIERITGGPGGAVRPQPSPNGKLLAFVKRVRTKTVLYIHNLETGHEYPVYDQLDKDQQEAWAIFGVYANYNWLPDNKNLVIWAKGKLWKVNIEGTPPVEIPFEATVNHKLAQTVRFDQPVHTPTFTAKAIRHAVTSPDGKTLVFNAAGHLYIKKLPNGKPRRLTRQTTHFEFEPAFSPDGNQLAFVTWHDQWRGSVMVLNMKSNKAIPIEITPSPGIYRTPAFSANGQRVVYRKDGGNFHQGYTYAKKPGLYWVAAGGGPTHFITAQGQYPTFSNDGQRVYYQTGGYYFGALDKGYSSVKVDGTDKKTHFTGKYANRFILSPDQKWLAFNKLHKVYLVPFTNTGKAINLNALVPAQPVQQVAEDAGISVHWSGNSQKLHWTLGDQYFTVNVKDYFPYAANSTAPAAKPVKEGTPIGLELTSDAPEGTVAFTNATIITVNPNDEVINKGTVLVEGNKIKAVGPNVAVPQGARVVDCTGKTIMPGMIDVHAHLGTFRYGLSPQKQWSYYANLAYGVTTTHDPSSNTEMVFSQSEMVKAGHMVGPRIYSTGIILYGAEGDFKAVINNLDDALSALRRTKAFGAFSVKSYNQPRREQRQQVIEAARQLKMHVYPEGGSTFFHNLTQVVDGHTGIEHNLPIAPLYGDVINLWKETQTGYTPTLIVNYGGNSGEYYWYQNTDVWAKERLLNFMPRSMVDSRARRVVKVPQEEYDNGHILVSQSCKALNDEGVHVNLGAHGQLQGLGAHWELWMLAQGGMSNAQALRAATMNGAWYLGMHNEIGSLEPGKLADLIVLDKNPLDDIMNTETVTHTMVNGRLYDAETLNEVGNYDNKRDTFYWEQDQYNEAFEWHYETQSIQRFHCSCGKH